MTRTTWPTPRNGAPWDEQLDGISDAQELERLWQTDLSGAEIARRLGRSYDAVMYQASKRELPRRDYARWHDWEEALVRQSAGVLRAPQIARLLQERGSRKHVRHVRDWAHNNGVDLRIDIDKVDRLLAAAEC